MVRQKDSILIDNNRFWDDTETQYHKVLIGCKPVSLCLLFNLTIIAE